MGSAFSKKKKDKKNRTKQTQRPSTPQCSWRRCCSVRRLWGSGSVSRPKLWFEHVIEIRFTIKCRIARRKEDKSRFIRVYSIRGPFGVFIWRFWARCCRTRGIAVRQEEVAKYGQGPPENGDTEPRERQDTAS
eukprot:30564_4